MTILNSEEIHLIFHVSGYIFSCIIDFKNNITVIPRRRNDDEESSSLQIYSFSYKPNFAKVCVVGVMQNYVELTRTTQSKLNFLEELSQ